MELVWYFHHLGRLFRCGFIEAGEPVHRGDLDSDFLGRFTFGPSSIEYRLAVGGNVNQYARQHLLLPGRGEAQYRGHVLVFGVFRHLEVGH
ncbi:hypothetical protein SLW73_12115 [Glutamicibacter protophormiae]|uniref:hypothetical protein n=1 Tax=Glutamicibacter protophormiae TaxID=37930 RepID=UPI002A8031AD|nr:hypothetical protein [Glutamicibacter protophormiae]WPR63629.1 hypothetical protein SLW72_12120 [Glutamicibacter protophormiae]WPR67124.1 hypothetical protein SLW73_12115 [Glutamicibacter protophormiae]